MEFKISMKKIAPSLIILFFISLPVNIFATEKMPLPRPENLKQVDEIKTPLKRPNLIIEKNLQDNINFKCFTSSTCLI